MSDSDVDTGFVKGVDHVKGVFTPPPTLISQKLRGKERGGVPRPLTSMTSLTDLSDPGLRVRFCVGCQCFFLARNMADHVCPACDFVTADRLVNGMERTKENGLDKPWLRRVSALNTGSADKPVANSITPGGRATLEKSLELARQAEEKERAGSIAKTSGDVLRSIEEAEPLDLAPDQEGVDHEEYPRISDVVPSVRFEGAPVKLEELLGFDMLVSDVVQFPSSYEGQDHYVVAQVEVDGDSLVVRTGARVIMDKLLRAQAVGRLPVWARVIQRKSRAGREYFDLE